MKEFSLMDFMPFFNETGKPIFRSVYYYFQLYNSKYQKDEQMAVVDGTQFLTEPWRPLKKIQKFVGVQQYINEDNFVVPKDGLPCFRENVNDHPACLKSTKGRSRNFKFPHDLTVKLHEFFRPFDQYFARQVLNRRTFEWNFGLDD